MECSVKRLRRWKPYCDAMLRRRACVYFKCSAVRFLASVYSQCSYARKHIHVYPHTQTTFGQRHPSQ
jgi:hypothetical protein